ncbi:MAG TPA: UDP-N-acetylmuramoyl-L-alanine--D-glutamate ligase [bacterium]|nr:UDP-N-acetylmuramoyl-L-alanine--D-glutamate ligase [bacterium]
MEQRMLPCREPLPPVAGSRVLVLGAGKCGLAASRLLHKAGAEVILSDSKSLDHLPEEVIQLQKLGIQIETGGHTLPANTGLIMRSPGVPKHIEVLRQAREEGVAIVSEIEVGSWFCAPRIIAITGTDGKSSVVTMVNQALNSSGWKSVEAGNIGTPLCEVVFDDCGRKHDFVVVEVSSYALENTYHFHPFVSVILNVAEDHLDHYESFEEYAETKGAIRRNQTEEDFLVLNAQDQWCLRFAEKSAATVRWFSLDDHGRDGAFLSESTVVYREGRSERTRHISLQDWFRHQKENLLASVVTTVLCGSEMESVVDALGQFRGLPHRIEFVRQLRGVTFYDDSKATTPHATQAALKSMERPVILIAGGDAKGTDITSLRPFIQEKVKSLVLLGKSRDLFVERFSDCVECQKVDSMQQAVTEAFLKAKKGDVVLLSPACSSLDMFRNFEQRGQIFKEAVATLL